MSDLVFLVLLLLIGYLFGSIAERRHYKSIRRREEEFRGLPIVATKYPPMEIPAPGSALVCGNVVISIDFFKKFVAGLRYFFGGRISAFETLLDRARREAVLRMKDEASKMGANYVFNVKLETMSIYKGRRNAIGSVEVLAYGTALIPQNEASPR